MRVAVLMSTYNGEKYLEEQIETILAQTGNFQLDLWVRDDGSTDLTRNILKQYEAEGKLRWYTGENLGPAKSFIDLVMHCKEYDFYAFADQDDYWLPDKINSAVQVLENKEGMGIYFSNAELVDAGLKSLGRGVYKKKPKLDFKTLTCAGGILGCAIVFNKNLAEAIQKKPMPKNMVMHDFYICELCLALGGSIDYDENKFVKYRQHQNNVVGVSYGIHRIIIERIKSIIHKSKVSIAEQSQEILRLYQESIECPEKEWLLKVIHYRDTLFNRFCLAVSSETRYINLNLAVELRLMILMGNR